MPQCDRVPGESCALVEETANYRLGPFGVLAHAARMRAMRESCLPRGSGADLLRSAYRLLNEKPTQTIQH